MHSPYKITALLTKGSTNLNPKYVARTDHYSFTNKENTWISNYLVLEEVLDTLIEYLEHDSKDVFQTYDGYLALRFNGSLAKEAYLSAIMLEEREYMFQYFPDEEWIDDCLDGVTTAQEAKDMLIVIREELYVTGRFL